MFRQGEMLLFTSKQPRAAAPLLREAAQLSPPEPRFEGERGDIEYCLGYASAWLGDPRDARAHWTTAAASYELAARRAPLLGSQQDRLRDLRDRLSGKIR
jgi:hypothetical protein